MAERVSFVIANRQKYTGIAVSSTETAMQTIALCGCPSHHGFLSRLMYFLVVEPLKQTKTKKNRCWQRETMCRTRTTNTSWIRCSGLSGMGSPSAARLVGLSVCRFRPVGRLIFLTVRLFLRRFFCLVLRSVRWPFRTLGVQKLTNQLFSYHRGSKNSLVGEVPAMATVVLHLLMHRRRKKRCV